MASIVRDFNRKKIAQQNAANSLTAKASLKPRASRRPPLSRPPRKLRVLRSCYQALERRYRKLIARLSVSSRVDPYL